MVEWYWWLLLAIPGLWVLFRLMRGTSKPPAHLLGKQAASMDWIAAGVSADSKGYKNLRVSKNGMQAVILFEKQRVQLVHPPVAQTFADFVELERWLKEQAKPKPAPAPAAPPAPAPKPKRSLEEELNYHTLLDEMTEECAAFMHDHELHMAEDWPIELHAEAIVYLACFNAKLGHRHQFSQGGWNTFKTSVENRMLGIRRIEGPRDPERERTAFVSYVSGYHGYLSERETLAQPAHLRSFELADQLLHDIGGPESARDLWRDHFFALVARGGKEVLFKVWMNFER